jgi:uncharacterized protein
MFENGEGTSVDLNAAFKHYQVCCCLCSLVPSLTKRQKAANLGIPPAAYNLANMYASGRGCKQSFENAFNCYAVAASRGDKPAKYFYATYLSEGRGCEKDMDLAIKVFVCLFSSSLLCSPSVRKN